MRGWGGLGGGGVVGGWGGGWWGGGGWGWGGGGGVGGGGGGGWSGPQAAQAAANFFQLGAGGAFRGAAHVGDQADEQAPGRAVAARGQALALEPDQPALGDLAGDPQRLCPQRGLDGDAAAVLEQGPASASTLAETHKSEPRTWIAVSAPDAHGDLLAGDDWAPRRAAHAGGDRDDHACRPSASSALRPRRRAARSSGRSRRRRQAARNRLRRDRWPAVRAATAAR